MGTLTWEYDTVNFTNLLSEIFLGNVTVARLKRLEGWDDLRGALVILEQENSQQYAGLQLKDPRDICGRHCYAMQATSILVCLLRSHDGSIANL